MSYWRMKCHLNFKRLLANITQVNWTAMRIIYGESDLSLPMVVKSALVFSIGLPSL